ncbi:hypothetical protein B7463_g6455, partial [Scytalidium lignicola]
MSTPDLMTTQQRHSNPIITVISNIRFKIQSFIFNPLAQAFLQITALLGLRQMTELYKPRPRHFVAVLVLALIGLFLFTAFMPRTIIHTQDLQQQQQQSQETPSPPPPPPPPPAPPPAAPASQEPVIDEKTWLTLNRILQPSKFPVEAPKPAKAQNI